MGRMGLCFCADVGAGLRGVRRWSKVYIGRVDMSIARCGPIGACMSIRRSLPASSATERRGKQGAERRTEALRGVARAVTLLPEPVALRAVRVRVVFVPDVVEEVDLLLLREERGRDAVHRRVAPALHAGQIVSGGARGREKRRTS